MTATGARETAVARTGHPAGEGYMRQLDGLRALAVGGVLIAHFLPGPMQFGLPWGRMGVLLFFVLSGFLITGILLRARDLVAAGGQTTLMTLRQFVVRRTLRIFPLYFAWTALMLLLDVGGCREWAASILTYTLNWVQAYTGETPRHFGHYWTLAVEEQFYLAWPLVILLVPARRTGLAIAAAVALSFACIVAADVAGYDQMARFTTNYLFVLVAGAALALRSHNADARQEPAGPLSIVYLVAGVLLCFGGIAVGGRVDLTVVERVGMTLISLWLISRAALGFGGPIGAMLSSRPLVYVGAISYGIYIIHMPLRGLFDQHAAGWANGFSSEVRDPALAVALLRALVWTVATLAVAALSFHLFEQPLNRLKRHFPMKLPARPTDTVSVRAPAAANP